MRRKSETVTSKKEKPPDVRFELTHLERVEEKIDKRKSEQIIALRIYPDLNRVHQLSELILSLEEEKKGILFARSHSSTAIKKEIKRVEEKHRILNTLHSRVSFFLLTKNSAYYVGLKTNFF